MGVTILGKPTFDSVVKTVDVFFFQERGASKVADLKGGESGWWGPWESGR